MRLALQTVLCWCVLITVLPLGGIGGATTVDFNSTLKKRFRLWLQNRMRRDIRSGSVAASSEEVGGPEISSAGTEQRQQGITEAFDFLSSFGPNRSKRSGCNLATCAVHDLYHRLHQLTDELKQRKAPEQKIKPNGYGRRRRRSAPELQYARSAALLHDGRQEPCCSHGVEHGEHAALPSLD